MSEQMTINKVVPKLRFSEFERNWKKIELNKLLEFKNGINASKEDYGFGYKFINVLDIIENDFITHDKIIGEVNVSKEVFDKNLVQYGDILFQRSSETREEVGQSNVYLDKINNATFGGFVIRGRKIGKYDPYFFHLLLKSSSARKEITTKSGGSTRYNVGQGILSAIKLCFPSLPEQQKIATFLTAVDDKIQALTKKQNLLEQYKKGVMQKIFSQELRFKDENGNDFTDWEEKKLGEFLENKSVRNKNLDYDLILSVSNSKGFILQTEQFDNHRVASKNVSNYKIVKKYDIAYNPSRINVGSIAILKNYECGIVSPMYIVFALKKGMNLMFFENLIETHLFKHLVIVGCSGSVRDSLNFDDLGSFKFSIPSISEQAKIANYLNSIDKKINQVNNQLDKAKQFKKGLLQQMFV